MIKSIKIENVKGIKNETFIFDNFYPNKPHILVAPNGFGKSSFAKCFNSLNRDRLKLVDDSDFFNKIESNKPKLSLQYTDENNVENFLLANENINEINKEFSIFVINSQLKAEGIGSQFGTASGRLKISDTKIMKIPKNVNFDYKITELKNEFGKNGKILINIQELFSNLFFLNEILSNYNLLDSLATKTNSKVLEEYQYIINCEIGSSEEIKKSPKKIFDEIDNSTYHEILNKLKSIYEYKFSKIDYFTIIYQILTMYKKNKNNFKKAVEYQKYKLFKIKLTEVFKTKYNFWQEILVKETKGNLIVSYPNPNLISNGQRDIITFISLLEKAKITLIKQNNILIIDEIFDYLDEANLISAQYYISTFIEEFKNNNRKIYPIVLTHLNPNIFKNYVFGKMKIHYLNKSNSIPNNNFIKLLKSRKNENIKFIFSKYFIHYHPKILCEKEIFKNLGLNVNWGDKSKFYYDINLHLLNYTNNLEYCPLMVCAGLRILIEEKVYNKIENSIFKEGFLETKETRPKLKKAEEYGVILPEYFFLLSIVYNEALHWDEKKDNITPIENLLSNITIKEMINEVVNYD